MPARTDIAVADAFVSGIEQDTGGRGVAEQVAVVLVSRSSDGASVNFGKSLYRSVGVDESDASL